MPWYPSAKACPAAIKPTVQCFFPTLYQVLLFNFSSFGEKLFFCLRGYAAQSRKARCKNSRSAERGCSSVPPPPNRRRMGGGNNPAPPPTGYRRAIARSAVQKQPERRALRPQARFGAQPTQAALGAEIGCSSVPPLPNRRRMGGGSNPAPPPTGYAAQSREARCKNSRSAERCARRRVSERNRRRRHLARR